MIINKTKYKEPVICTDGNNTWFEEYEKEYECNKCGEYIHESYPHHSEKEKDHHLCWDCAFIEGVINSKEYMEFQGGLDAYCDAYVHEGEIELVKKGRKPPWETKTETRYDANYCDWREDVYERDDYTCQKCGQKGGELNAHHIKSYSDYPDLRLDKDNGITLCVKCHKNKHKAGD